MTLKLTHAYHRNNDVLEVHGTDVDGNDVVANGWVSATTNHFDDAEWPRDADGHRAPDATAREMTDVEVRAYCQSLLDATVPPPPAASEPTIRF